MQLRPGQLRRQRADHACARSGARGSPGSAGRRPRAGAPARPSPCAAAAGRARGAAASPISGSRAKRCRNSEWSSSTREHEAELVDPGLARRAQLDDAVRLLPRAAGPAARPARRPARRRSRCASRRCRGAEWRGGSTAPAAEPRRRSPRRAVVCGGGGLGGQVGGALEHLERLLLAAGAAQELAPGAVGLDVVAPVPLLLEQRGRLPEGVVRAVGVARQRERLRPAPRARCRARADTRRRQRRARRGPGAALPRRRRAAPRASPDRV